MQTPENKTPENQKIQAISFLLWGNSALHTAALCPPYNDRDGSVIIIITFYI